MALSNSIRDRQYQYYKDAELFGSFTAGPTAGSIVLNTPTERTGDLLLINAGSGDVFYNLGVSGGGVAVSTSGIILTASSERVYNNVGFDVVALKTTAGSVAVYVHKIYSDRP